MILYIIFTLQLRKQRGPGGWLTLPTMVTHAVSCASILSLSDLECAFKYCLPACPKAQSNGLLSLSLSSWVIHIVPLRRLKSKGNFLRKWWRNHSSQKVERCQGFSLTLSSAAPPLWVSIEFILIHRWGSIHLSDNLTDIIQYYFILNSGSSVFLERISHSICGTLPFDTNYDI